MALYKNVNLAISDKYFTQPLPQVSIPIKNPVNAGPFTSNKDYSQGPFIQNFNIPRMQDKPTENCPYRDNLFRNPYELLNTGNGKSSGGFDAYNVYNIPACQSKYGNYMTFSNYNDPFNTTLASEANKNNWYRDLHN